MQADVILKEPPSPQWETRRGGGCRGLIPPRTPLLSVYLSIFLSIQKDSSTAR